MAFLYAIYPGGIHSRSDDDYHHIGAPQLARLYGVPMARCIVVNRDDYLKPWLRERVAYAATLIPLYPRRSGDYMLPLR